MQGYNSAEKHPVSELKHVMTLKTEIGSNRDVKIIKVLKLSQKASIKKSKKIEKKKEIIKLNPSRDKEIRLTSSFNNKIAEEIEEATSYIQIAKKLETNPLTIEKFKNYLAKEENKRMKQKSLKKINKTIVKSLRRSQIIAFYDIK